ncbi:hypothetical protein DPMN_194323 [Dreissena polymorpha]|uniref:CCHC-type domain-containing protein n=1 Tax=Dreissena polymorpha TaxID=45954 RepID=A0A9D3Y558_DREPO|nr:hypothetical protein DPMN_194323 [Dreissena polymorpha]
MWMLVERLERRLDERMMKSVSSSTVYRHIRGENEQDRRCYLCGSQKHRKRQCPHYRQRKQHQKISTSMKPEELQKDALGGIRVLIARQVLKNMDPSARENLIRGESQVKRTVPNGGSNKYALRKMNKPLRSQPTYEIADAGMSSVKYEAGIKKKTAVLIGD